VVIIHEIGRLGTAIFRDLKGLVEMAKNNGLMNIDWPRALFSRVTAKGAFLRDPKVGVAGMIAGLVILAVAFEPSPVPESGLWYDVEGRLVAERKVDIAKVELQKPRGVTVVPGSAGKLYTDFRSIGYKLEDVRAGTESVPRVFVRVIPQDIRGLSSVDQRKAVFIKTMLPLILRVNEELRQVRARIRDLSMRARQGNPLTVANRDWLNKQYERFDVTPGRINVLLRRVDVIPPSLALAQAAEESGWGTSRFALEGRALFGQRTHADGPGLVPAAHAGETVIKVKSFSALLDGVRSYARNLNTHAAYTGFRKLRAQMRETARSPIGLNSMNLVELLESYSERGTAYVKAIQSIIRGNNLRQLDGASLSNNMAPVFKRQGA
jgi:Bax protein